MKHFSGNPRPAIATGQTDGACAPPDDMLAELPEWNLDDLYQGEDSAELQADFDWLESECEKFARNFAGRICDLDADGLFAAITTYEDISRKFNRIGSFAGLRFAENTTDPRRGKFVNDCEERLTDLTGRLVFLDLEIAEIDDARYRAMLAEHTGLDRYRPVLDRIRKQRPYLLPLQLEQYIVDRAVAGRSAWIRLFDETIARMRFQVGKKEETIEETLAKLSDHDRSVRKTAADALSRSVAQDLPLLTLITNTLAKEKAVDDKWRRFPSPQASRHLANEVDAEVVESLKAAVVGSYQRIAHRYYRLKARWLGLERLEFWDRSAPLPVESTRMIGWQEARETVLGAFSGFSPEMAEIGARFFDRRWIDVPIRPGKAAGAFSHPTTSDAHPYILLNYTGKPRDVMVLAHELGHGVHQVLAAGQGELLSQTPLTIAETASVFGEMLTFRELLKSAQTSQERQVLLSSKLEDMINTVIRQIAFYEFESRLHEQRAEGELTSEDISGIWMEIMGESLGPAVHLADGYRTYWSYVPHFIHSPFYVYAYAFGHGLVHALYARYEAGSEDFQSRYFSLLKAGGAKDYKQLLAPFGLDPTDPAFWNIGLNFMESLVVELESLNE